MMLCAALMLLVTLPAAVVTESWVTCNWLPGFAWVHWTGFDFVLAWHAVCVFLWDPDCVAVFDLCVWLQPVVQEVWQLCFSGLAACVG